MRTPLRPLAAACVLAAVLAAGSPAQAADRPARRPQPTSVANGAGGMLGSLQAFLAQATDALRSLWSPAVEAADPGEETRGTAAAVDLADNGAGIDPNG